MDKAARCMFRNSTYVSNETVSSCLKFEATVNQSSQILCELVQSIAYFLLNVPEPTKPLGDGQWSREGGIATVSSLTIRTFLRCRYIIIVIVIFQSFFPIRLLKYR